jgi:hypothetical protein
MSKSFLLPYIDLLEEVFYYFFKLKNSIYNFDLLNDYKNNYKIEYSFPFFLKEKKKNLFFNNKPRYLNNISLSFFDVKSTTQLFSFSFFINYINLFFFFFKYKLIYFYSYRNKLMVSPRYLELVLNEQKKLFYYFSVIFHVNVIHLL